MNIFEHMLTGQVRYVRNDDVWKLETLRIPLLKRVGLSGLSEFRLLSLAVRSWKDTIESFNLQESIVSESSLQILIVCAPHQGCFSSRSQRCSRRRGSHSPSHMDVFRCPCNALMWRWWMSLATCISLALVWKVHAFSHVAARWCAKL